LGRWSLAGGIALSGAVGLFGATITSAASGSELERISVGVPNQLTLPPTFRDDAVAPTANTTDGESSTAQADTQHTDEHADRREASPSQTAQRVGRDSGPVPLAEGKGALQRIE
jgi:hypothetical protein